MRHRCNTESYTYVYYADLFLRFSVIRCTCCQDTEGYRKYPDPFILLFHQ